MNNYYFSESVGRVKTWHGPYLALSVERAWREHCLKTGRDPYPWAKAKPYFFYKKENS